MAAREHNTTITKEEHFALIRFERAINTAQHYHLVSWVISSIFFIAMVMLLGYVVNHFNEEDLQLLIFASLMGMILTLFVLRMHETFNGIVRQHYRRSIWLSRSIFPKILKSSRMLRSPIRRAHAVAAYFYVITLLIGVFWLLFFIIVFLYFLG